MIKTLIFIWRKAAEVALFLSSWSIWPTLSTTVSNLSKDVPATLMVMMIMMNCFCGMVDWRKTFSLIFSQDHCQRSWPSQTTPQSGFEPAQNLSSDLVEWSFEVMIINPLTVNFTVSTLRNWLFSREFGRVKQKQFSVQEMSLSDCFSSLQVTQMRLRWCGTFSFFWF